jgi:hypothetical protein
LVRAGLVLVLVGIAGFGLGAYGGGIGSALGAQTDTTATQLTTTETITEASTTIETTLVTTTAPAPTTTTPATTATPTTTPTTAPTTTTGESSSSGTPWGWIALGIGVAALLIGLGLWQRHRAGTASWRSKAAALHRRCLVALDEVVAKGSVVTGQIEALAADARSLEASAPDDAAKVATGEVRARLDDLTQALESDRRLRLGSPPPTDEQLSYSTSVIRQQVEQLQSSLRQQSAGPKP